MIVKFRNPDDEIFETHKNLGNCLQFYPLCIDGKENFYGLVFVPKESDRDIKQLFSSNFFEILDFANENVLFFKTKCMFQFYPHEDKIMKPFILKNGFIYFFTTKNEKWDVYFPIEYLNELDFKCESFRDNLTNDLNLLGVLAISAKYLDKKEKESLISAINFGYPVSDLIDFQKREVILYKDKIFRKWRDRLAYYFGDREKIFVRLLQRSTRKLIKNNKELFEKISLCTCGENGSFTAKSFLKFMDTIPTREKIFLEKSMPKLFVNKLIIESVLAIEKEKIDDLRRNISFFLENYPITGWLIDEWEDEDLPLSFKGYRFAFLWDISSKRVTISEFADYAEEVKEVVLAALRKTDKNGCPQSLKKEQEFWIRSIDVSLFLPAIFSDIALEVIKENFAAFLDRYDTSQLIRKKISLDRYETSQLIRKKMINDKFCLLSFRLRYPMFYDYRISKRKFGYFYEIRAIDKFTRQGIEAARKYLFSKSLALLERGSHAIAGDILVWKSKFVKGHEKAQYLKEARMHYQLAGIPSRSRKSESFTDKQKRLGSLMNFSSNLMSDLRYLSKKASILIGRLDKPLYLPKLDSPKLLIAQQQNYDWRIAVESYLIGKSMKDDILGSRLEHNGEDDEKSNLADMYLAYSGLQSAKDSVCLVEDLCVFYARLVEEIQRKFGDLTAEWLGFNF